MEGDTALGVVIVPAAVLATWQYSYAANAASRKNNQDAGYLEAIYFPKRSRRQMRTFEGG